MEIELTDDFEKSLKKFDKTAIARIFQRLERIEMGNFGDYKDLGDGLFELRLFFGARVYYGEIKKEH